MANYETNTPSTGDTLFDIASCAKSLTAAAVALLVEDKDYPDVQYEARMFDLLPDDFVISEKSYTDGITVEDVLSPRTAMTMPSWGLMQLIRITQSPSQGIFETSNLLLLYARDIYIVIRCTPWQHILLRRSPRRAYPST